MAPRTRIRLCGPLELEIDGQEVAGGLPGGQAGLLLGYLVANRGRAADRAALIDVVWPTRPPKDPQADLRPILSRLRRALGPDALEGKDQLRVALPEPVWVDLEEAARAVEGARVAARSASWQHAREHAKEALDLLRPGFMPGHEGDWVDARRLELEELELEALEWVARAGLALGGTELGSAERAARELVARSPFRETGYRFLMEALAAGGNVAEALRVYDRLRRLLRDELGVPPAAEVQAVHRRLLAGDAAPQPAPKRVPLPALLSPRERGAFIAREPELEALRGAWERARAGRRQLVLLGGEPGIGKTRLTSELALAAHADGTVLYAACQEQALLSYQPFVEALRHYARNRPLDAPLGPGAIELARLIPELAPTDRHALPGDPEARRYLMFEAVSDLLTAASARAPVLLVLDDLHWADGPTLQLLRHVLRAQQEASLLIVGAYREAEIAAGHPLSELLADLRRDRLFERISLTGLDEPGVAALISSHAGHEAPSALVRTVHEETAGNPFFVEEVMRHLIESGVLFEREGRWTSALTADEIGVPDGVKEVLERRLARLSDDSRTALSDAAVLGREFSFDVLRLMTGSDEDALIAALEEAVAAQLIVETGGRYAFTHALVRETLHGALSGPRRQRMHARAAEALERAEEPAGVAALAVHHRLAGSAGDPAKALDCSLRAGQQARELFAWEEAAAHWDGALAVMERTGGHREAQAALLVGLADLMVVVGDLARQIAYLERALALYEELGDEERTAQAHSRLGMAHSLIDSIYSEHLDIGRAFRHFDAARPVLARGPVRKARGHREVGVATALTYGLRIGPGMEAAERAMEIAELLGDEALWAGAAEACAWHKIVAGELREGLALVVRAFESADRQQRSFLAWMATNMPGQLTWGLGDPDAAQAFVERPLRLPYVGKTAYRQQIADGVGRCHASRGEIAEARALLSDAKPTWITHSLKPLLDLWDGDWDAVDSLATQVLETSRRTGNRWDEWASYHLAARVASLRGEHAHAGELLEDALAIVVDGGARYFEMWVRPDLARVLVESGRLDEARAHLARCREIMSAGEDWRGRVGHVELAEAVVLGAEDRFTPAVATLRRYKLRVDEADALHQWGCALERAGDASGAAEKRDAALEIYLRHGAGAPWLERVRRGARARGTARG
jgi:DNA-binding SARP family transcriptional activator/ATP/maltotriose-dependent transcriptional regulator MalT